MVEVVEVAEVQALPRHVESVAAEEVVVAAAVAVADQLMQILMAV